MDTKQPLSGKYRISFDVNLSAEDALSEGDIIQALAYGFDGHPVLEKIGGLQVSRMDVTHLKVGDRVRVRHSLAVTSTAGLHDNIAVVASSFFNFDQVYPVSFTLPECTATVNQITASGIELIDFDVDTVVLDNDVQASLFSIVIPEEHLEVKE